MAVPCGDAYDVSVVVPCYNEEHNVGPLHERLRSVLSSAGLRYEIIFVDDGSKDGTFEALSQLCRHDDCAKVVRFRRNFGQTSALSAGFDHASGRAIVAIDADLQYQPEDIPKLLAKLDEGFDIASGWRAQRNDAFITRKLPSRIANKMMARVSGVQVHDFGSTFKAYRCGIIKEIKLYGEMHRFVPALASAVGARIAEVPVELRPRTHGKSNYGLSRVWRVLLDILSVKFFISYAKQPLRLFGLAGMATSAIGIAILLALTGAKLFAGEPFGEHQPLLLLGILLVLGGLQFFSFGLMAELITRTYHESQDKPIYSLRERIGDFPQDGSDGRSPDACSLQRRIMPE